MADHTCHRPGCATKVPPKMFACLKHWFSLPTFIRAKIQREYRPGQEIDKHPSKAYLDAAMLALDFWRARDAKHS